LLLASQPETQASLKRLRRKSGFPNLRRHAPTIPR
jgi:hypothetical protein